MILKFVGRNLVGKWERKYGDNFILLWKVSVGFVLNEKL